MSKLTTVGKTVVADLLQLDNPAVVAGVSAAVVADLNVLGVNAGPHGAQIALVLAAAGAVTSAAKKLTQKGSQVKLQVSLKKQAPPAPVVQTANPKTVAIITPATVVPVVGAVEPSIVPPVPPGPNG